MGCGSSAHGSRTSTLEHRVPASLVQVQEIGAKEERTSNDNRVGGSVNSSSDTFCVNPEPHEGFLPCISPSTLELACRSTVEKLVPRKSEEHTRKEIEELIRQWGESGQLADIESYSLSAPPSLTRSVVQLADFLTRNSATYIKAIQDGAEIHIQIAKAYCIYSWIANNITFDRHQWQAYQTGDDNLSLENYAQTEHVLERRTTVSSGYANLFKSLANESGLTVEVIHGSMKGWKSQTAESQDNDFEPSRKNTHTWNLVTIGGITYPVDCTMGSGFISPSTEYQKDFTHHFFAVPPQRMVLTHWPPRVKQQLLKETLTLRKFQPLIPLSPKAAKFGINPDTWSEFFEIPIEVNDPVISVKLTCNSDVKLVAKLSNIKQEVSDNTQEIANQKLVFIDRDVSSINRETSTVTIRAVVPYTGRYVLNIYACKSSRSTPSSNYEVVLSYQIQCSTDVRSQFQIGYPMMYDMAAAAFDFRLLHWNKPMLDYCCEISSGKLDIAFRAKPDLQFFHYIVEGEAENPDNPRNVHHYNTLIAQNTCGDPCLYALRSVFPSEGWWTVYLCATKAIDSDPQQPTSGYTTIFKYCVHVNSGIINQSFPHITASYIKLLQQEPISISGSEILNVPFSSQRPLEFYCYLTYETQTSELLENYATVAIKSSQHEESQEQQHYNLSVVFPKPGKWYIHVFGRDLTTSKQKYTGLFTLRVDIDSALKDKMFPTINMPIATALNISGYDTGCITFRDDGSPFTYKFQAPRKNIHLIPNISPNDKKKDAKNFDKKFLQRCTMLVPSVADDSELSVYTMNAVFPSAGTWSVQLFGALSDSNSDGYDLVMHVQLEVTKPTHNMCYPIVFPAFYDLGLSIPNELLLYSQVSEASEINLPFNSPEGVLFDTRLCQGDEVFINQAIVYHGTGAASNVGTISHNRNLHIIFPKTGEWDIHLYAGNCNVAQQESYQHETNIEKEAVLELKVQALSYNDGVTFPQVFDPFHSRFSLKLDEERYPLISRVDRFPSKITIPFYSPPDIQFWHRAKSLESEAVGATRLYSEEETGLHELTVEVAERGQLIVTLNAQSSDSSDKQKREWIAVLKHTVKAL